MDYGSVLKRTWDITWKYKGLWVLGILAACGNGGGGGGGGGGGQASSSVRGGGPGNGDFSGLQGFFNNIPEEAILIAVIAIVALLLVVALIALVLGVIGQGGLVAGFNQADEGADVNLAEAFGMGMHFFWRLLGLRVLLFVATLVVIIALGLFVVLTLGIGILCLLPLLCVLIPAMILVDVYVTLTSVALVVEDLGVFAAFRRAWDVARANIGPLLVMTVILIFGPAIVGLLFAAPFILILVPVVTAFVLGTQTAINSGMILAGVCLVLYLPVLIVLNGILNTYVFGAWTLTFRRLTGRPGLVPEAMPDGS